MLILRNAAVMQQRQQLETNANRCHSCASSSSSSSSSQYKHRKEITMRRSLSCSTSACNLRIAHVSKASLGRKGLVSRCVRDNSNQQSESMSLTTEMFGSQQQGFPLQGEQNEQIEKGSKDVEVKPRRGRPAGIPAWNKGIPCSPKTRESIAAAMRKKWTDPDFRDRVSTTMRLKYSKGKDQSTKISSKNDMQEISALDDKESGSLQEQDKNISDRENNADNKSDADFQQQAQEGLVDGPVTKEAKRIMAALKMEASFQAQSGNYSGRSKRRTGANAIASLDARLRAYREVKAELSPWSQSFQEKHGRLPTIEDAESTKNAWLVRTFSSYMVLRIQLFQELQELRGNLGSESSFSMKKNKKKTRSPAGRDVLSAFSYLKKENKTTGDTMSSVDRLPTPMTPGARVSSAFASAHNYKQDNSKVNGVSNNMSILMNVARAQTSTSDPSGRVASAFLAAAKYKKSKSSINEEEALTGDSSNSSNQSGSSLDPLEEESSQTNSDQLLMDVARSQTTSSDPSGRLASAFAAAARYKRKPK